MGRADRVGRGAGVFHRKRALRTSLTKDAHQGRGEMRLMSGKFRNGRNLSMELNNSACPQNSNSLSDNPDAFVGAASSAGSVDSFVEARDNGASAKTSSASKLQEYNTPEQCPSFPISWTLLWICDGLGTERMQTTGSVMPPRILPEQLTQERGYNPRATTGLSTLN